MIMGYSGIFEKFDNIGSYDLKLSLTMMVILIVMIMMMVILIVMIMMMVTLMMTMMMMMIMMMMLSGIALLAKCTSMSVRPNLPFHHPPLPHS